MLGFQLSEAHRVTMSLFGALMIGVACLSAAVAPVRATPPHVALY